MNPTPVSTYVIHAESVELLDDGTLTLEQLAQACCLTPQWLHNRVQAGVLTPAAGMAEDPAQSTQWRFSSATLVRARRVADLERHFDADPQLAALAVDLMEEVALLRKRLQAFASSEID
ncbi:MAG: chaperone modulator CbpM [Brachymonas sp.]|nr:chaperone modulator CbpM [Brachymonas sp.]